MTALGLVRDDANVEALAPAKIWSPIVASPEVVIEVTLGVAVHAVSVPSVVSSFPESGPVTYTPSASFDQYVVFVGVEPALEVEFL
jgi:hypothetical protein